MLGGILDNLKVTLEVLLDGEAPTQKTTAASKAQKNLTIVRKSSKNNRQTSNDDRPGIY